MVKYRIPLSDKEALAKFRVEDPKKEKPFVKSWNIIIDLGIVEVESEKEIKELEKYKVKG